MNLYNLHTDKSKLLNFEREEELMWTVASTNNYPNGEIEYINVFGNFSKKDGPAKIIKSIIGNEEYWYKNGLLHREDGPAVSGGYLPTEYWVNGVKSK